LKVLSERGKALVEAGEVVQELREPAGKRFPKRPPMKPEAFAPEDEGARVEDFEAAAARASGAARTALLQKASQAARSERTGCNRIALLELVLRLNKPKVLDNPNIRA
jgi:hypothetical protein